MVSTVDILHGPTAIVKMSFIWNTHVVPITLLVLKGMQIVILICLNVGGWLPG